MIFTAIGIIAFLAITVRFSIKTRVANGRMQHHKL